jgi:hypothetical protein
MTDFNDPEQRLDYLLNHGVDAYNRRWRITSPRWSRPSTATPSAWCTQCGSARSTWSTASTAATRPWTAPARSREVKHDQALPRDHHWAAQRVRCAFSRRVRNIPHRTAANLSARAARFFARFNAHEIGVVVYCAACIEVPFCAFSQTSSSA